MVSPKLRRQSVIPGRRDRMNIIPTELNQRLSKWVRNRVAADQSVVLGRVYFWRLVGLGVAVFGLGTAIGLGFYGYSFVRRNTDNMPNLLAAFSNALADAQLHATAEGTVQIEPREIALAQDQTISLERNSVVILDPAAKVQVDGEVKIQAPPTISIPRATTQPSATAPTITNFTVFKSVPFEKGTVMTGWKFLTSSQKSPTEEYCYYSVDTAGPGVGVVLNLGDNQKPDIPETVPANFDIAAAFDKCVWFRGATR
jgi:hypothetical protein